MVSTAVTARKRYLTPSQQAFAIRSLLPDAKVTLRGGTRLTMTADLQPTSMSRTYSIKIAYQSGLTPDVHVVAPQLQLHQDAVVLPHTYPGDKLCLHLPGEWHPTMYLAHTTIPWTSEWLFYYELWLITGRWEGGGHGEPNSPDKEEHR
jgi:hypothetical protein